ncbi:hypothetical protein [Bradyrhizobium sp. AZCC 2230]|uniref:hypothetical protein n=1 Tax=Bradyrhizobium sp. AZCC 2230 TaxID=3117021 RepID=UPI002FF16524
MSNTEIALQTSPVTRVTRIKDFMFVGAFVLATVAATFGWVAALGWGAFRLGSWLF